MMPTIELFSPYETRTLLALADCVVPPDQNGPGGADGGAAHLLRELDPGGALSQKQDDLRLFLIRLNEAADGDFSALEPKEQDALLTQFETHTETAALFRQIVEWITEGFYASPAGWDMVGFRPVDRGMR
jgi:hypothetical protein